jgi:hypothetical protein
MKPAPDRWKHRRAMAWLALLGGLGYPALALWLDSQSLAAMSAGFYVFVGAVVGAYVGFATVDDRWQAGNEPWRFGPPGAPPKGDA